MAKTVFPPPPPRPVLPKSTLPIFIRRGGLADAAEIGRIAARTYLHDDLEQYCNPGRFQHYRVHERGYINRATKRLLQPNSLCFVACTTADPATPVAYAQFQRLGNDAAALALIKETPLRWRILLWVFGWVYEVFCRVWLILVGGNEGEDMDHIRIFLKGLSGDEHWDSHDYPERTNRWHARSVVVSAEFQQRGIGKMFMNEVISRAEKENVVVGLESSIKGEKLYRSMGFEWLGKIEAGEELSNKKLGSVMLVSYLNSCITIELIGTQWTPPAWKDQDSVEI